MAPLPGMVPLYIDITFQSTCDLHHKFVVHAILNTIAEEAMNFMSYVAEVSREWDMKAKIAAMARRLEKLEMMNMQPVQAISQTPLQAMPCAICLSYEHLVDECPTIPAEREMFGDCNTYNSNWKNHPNFSWKARATQYQQPDQPSQQSSSLEQAIANLSKVVGDFVGNQEAINAQLSQRIDRAHKFEHSARERNFPSQPYQNSMSIHEVEAQEGESSMVKEIEEVITLRSGKEVDMPTCKLEHKVESETEKEKGRKSKERKRGKVQRKMAMRLMYKENHKG
ncbi:hypothetical protein CK203_054620 [Vitis vinifera]|uniref:Retrotransposon gag domain-containing protein n=1 Tax=Vitis vinifera TaxID=29760 RepID=A0A438GRR5_VITVI|nr:hypothetical protein CK203_054620 [Vitis vinifera]